MDQRKVSYQARNHLYRFMNRENGQSSVAATALLQLGRLGFVRIDLVQYQTNTVPDISQAIAIVKRVNNGSIK